MRSTVNHLLQEAIAHYAEDTALKEKQGTRWVDLSFGALGKAIEEVGTALISLGLTPGAKVGLFVNKGCNWLVGDLAVLGSGAVDVPRGNDLAFDELAYIAGHAEIKTVITDMPPDMVPRLRREVPAIEHVIVTGKEVSPGEQGLVSWETLRTKGREALSRGDRTFSQRMAALSEGDLATIVYTSGTTGRPKGVMLSHGNLAKNVVCISACVPVKPGERFLSLLPPYHMFERTIEYVALSNGASLIFSDPHNFRRDLISHQPNFVTGVPRLWEMVYHGAMERLRKEKHHRLIKRLLAGSQNYVRARRRLLRQEARCAAGSGPAPRSSYVADIVRYFADLPLHVAADRLIYRAVRKSLGDRLRIAVSGGGTLPPHLDDFFEMVGITLVNGYGLTETSPVLTIRRPEANIKGTVGRPIVETEIKICNKRGEEVEPGSSGAIWAKGPQVMQGYFKDEEATARVLKDGWFNTGDLGALSPEGDLVITGRAKDTIVLSGGENVEPEPVETALVLSPFISQAMVVGQDRKYLAALIVPHMRAIKDYCAEGGIACGEEDLVRNQAVLDVVKSEINRLHNKKECTRSWEKIVRFLLIPEEWTATNGLMTFTLKKKRAVIAARYAKSIESLYQ